jgi:hypothetical protein
VTESGGVYNLLPWGLGGDRGGKKGFIG